MGPFCHLSSKFINYQTRQTLKITSSSTTCSSIVITTATTTIIIIIMKRRLSVIPLIHKTEWQPLQKEMPLQAASTAYKDEGVAIRKTQLTISSHPHGHFKPSPPPFRWAQLYKLIKICKIC